MRKNEIILFEVKVSALKMRDRKFIFAKDDLKI